MTISRVELQGQTLRAQDFTTIKHNEDSASAVQQSQIVSSSDKAVDVKLHHVNDTEQAENRPGKFDAKEKGNGEYSGDGGGQRKKQPHSDGQVFIKGTSHGFDLKI